jgi:hypothetical protein
MIDAAIDREAVERLARKNETRIAFLRSENITLLAALDEARAEMIDAAPDEVAAIAAMTDAPTCADDDHLGTRAAWR